MDTINNEDLNSIPQTHSSVVTNTEALADQIQQRLNLVNLRLRRHALFKGLSASQLPSQAASDTSISPPLGPLAGAAGRFARSPLSLVAIDAFDGEIEEVDGLLDQRLADFGHTYSDGVNSSQDKTQSIDGVGQSSAVDGAVSAESFRALWTSFSNMTIPSSDGSFALFEHDHKDQVCAVDFNYYGTRMVTASSDHTLKVWDKKDDSWALLDSWRAHDAEVTDVKWNGPFLGAVLGSIGEDGKFKLWQEDVTEAPKQGKRFKLVCSMGSMSETRVPYMSMDFKNILTETYLALVTRDGFLSIMEPTNQEDLRSWSTLYSPKEGIGNASRTDEASFRVCWHKEQIPCYNMVRAGLDRKALSIAVASMNTVKILRTDKDRNFYLAAEITGSKGILRDVAWANGSMRGWDIIATASKDGHLRIYELHPAQPGGSDSVTLSDTVSIAESTRTVATSTRMLSGIGAGLANTAAPEKAARDDSKFPGRVRNTIKKVAEMAPHSGSVWRVVFSQIGDLLVSTGNDGVVKTWKRAINGQWLEFAQIEIEEPSDDDVEQDGTHP